MKKRLLIAGGTGLIGEAIREEGLKRGWEVVVLSRKPSPSGLKWDPQNEEISLSGSGSFDAIINLAGTPIADGRWTEKRIKDIRDSRVQACHTLHKYLASGLLSTNIYIGSSAIGIYGDHGDAVVDEQSSLGEDSDWMVATGKAWEEGHARMVTLGIRTVILRTGIVLSPKGGALKEILKTAPFGLIGYFGNGQQFWPWIHIQDLVSITLKVIMEEKMSGIYMAAAPGSVTCKELSQTASSMFYPRRLVVPVPELIMKLLLGKMRRMLLQSCRGYPVRLIQEGFSFHYPMIKEAMKDLIRKVNSKP